MDDLLTDESGVSVSMDMDFGSLLDEIENVVMQVEEEDEALGRSLGVTGSVTSANTPNTALSGKLFNANVSNDNFSTPREVNRSNVRIFECHNLFLVNLICNCPAGGHP
jgi:hypothetical protein